MIQVGVEPVRLLEKLKRNEIKIRCQQYAGV